MSKTRKSPPLAGQPFTVDDSVFNTHRQNQSFNLAHSDTSQHTMNNQQDQTNKNLDATTHNVDTDNIQIDNHTEDQATAQQETTDQTNSCTEETNPNNCTGTIPRVDNNNTNHILRVVHIQEPVTHSNSPNPDFNHHLKIPTDEKLIFMTLCTQLEDNKLFR
jgi:hypothetical protein